MTKLSIVIPVYYNKDNLKPLYADIKEKILHVIDFEYELIMVDDGSQDGSFEIMQELAREDSNIRIFKLSRNFGAHPAVLCGLSKATGDCVVIKSADLQEPSELILDMYASWKNGNNVVLAVREGREDSSFFSNLYYKLTRKIALSNMPEGGFDAFLIDRKVVKVLEMLDEKNSSLTGQILWSGFKTDKIYYTRKAREIGRSRWTLKKKIRLVADTMYSFSYLPVTLVQLVGVLCCTGSVIWAIIIFIGKCVGNIETAGFTTLFIFQLFSFGVIMLSLGILGGYIWRTFDSTRNRPVYIIEESNEEEKEKRGGEHQ